MSKQPSGWDEALVNAGFVDSRTGKPSYNRLAKAVGVPQSTVSAVVTGKSRHPKPETVQRIADALRVDVRTVAAWVGQKRTEATPYAPPPEADLLTDRQRKAVDEIIRAIVAERASNPDATPPAVSVSDHAAGAAVASDPVPHGTTSTPERPWEKADFDLAADTGVSKRAAMDEAARRRGEESQAPEDWA